MFRRCYTATSGTNIAIHAIKSHHETWAYIQRRARNRNKEHTDSPQEVPGLCGPVRPEGRPMKLWKTRSNLHHDWMRDDVVALRD